MCDQGLAEMLAKRDRFIDVSPHIPGTALVDSLKPGGINGLTREKLQSEPRLNFDHSIVFSLLFSCNEYSHSQILIIQFLPF